MPPGEKIGVAGDLKQVLSPAQVSIPFNLPTLAIFPLTLILDRLLLLLNTTCDRLGVQ